MGWKLPLGFPSSRSPDVSFIPVCSSLHVMYFDNCVCVCLVCVKGAPLLALHSRAPRWAVDLTQRIGGQDSTGPRAGRACRGQEIRFCWLYRAGGSWPGSIGGKRYPAPKESVRFQEHLGSQKGFWAPYERGRCHRTVTSSDQHVRLELRLSGSRGVSSLGCTVPWFLPVQCVLFQPCMNPSCHFAFGAGGQRGRR